MAHWWESGGWESKQQGEENQPGRQEMNQDVKGKEWKEKILKTCKSLSLPSTLKSHLKGKCGEMAGGTFTPLQAMESALWNRKPGKPGSDTLWDFPGQHYPLLAEHWAVACCAFLRSHSWLWVKTEDKELALFFVLHGHGAETSI